MCSRKPAAQSMASTSQTFKDACSYSGNLRIKTLVSINKAPITAKIPPTLKRMMLHQKIRMKFMNRVPFKIRLKKIVWI